MLAIDGASSIRLANKNAYAPDGRFVPLSEIALDTLHRSDQEQIMGDGFVRVPIIAAPFCSAVR